MGSSEISVRNTSIDLLGGTCGGMLQAIVGHPLDLIKAKMQSSVVSESVWGAVKHIQQAEGILGFYRGVSPPLAMAGILNAVIFTTNTFFKRILTVNDPKTHETKPLTLPRIVLASWLTTPVYCSVLAPVEMIKVRMQLQNSSAVKSKAFTGPIDCLKQILRNEGFLGLYNGFIATLGTRFVGLPFYFGGFETAKKYLMMARNETISGQASSVTMLVAGGVGGLAFWGANFPIDLIKTNMQAGGKQSGSLSVTVKRIYSQGGIKAFYRGITPCLLRSVPANSVAFFGYEKTVSLFKNKLSH